MNKTGWECGCHMCANLVLPSNHLMFAAYADDDADETYGFRARTTTDAGQNWVPVRTYRGTEIVPDAGSPPVAFPSLAGSGSDVYIAYEAGGEIYFRKSDDWGSSVDLGSGGYPCIAAIGSYVFVCWRNGSDRIAYRFSKNSGDEWEDEAILSDGISGGSFHQANVSAILCNGHLGILLVCERRYPGADEDQWIELFEQGELFNQADDHLSWWDVGLAGPYTSNPDLRPSLAVATNDGIVYLGRNVYNAQIGDPDGPPSPHKRGFHLRYGIMTLSET
jgi:hypothetical protein